MDVTAEQIIRHFDLRPLAGEGGMFRQTYLATERIPHQALPSRYSHDKPLGTAIVYLLTDAFDSFSEMHTLPTDEVYHFYRGDPVDMLLLHPDGRGERVQLGPDFLNGQHVQFVVPRGVWQGSRLAPGGRWALLGTTMAPGYTDSDYVGSTRAKLFEKYPRFAPEIAHLTRR
jgi:predicted cupin superfamily sugar epimerase